MSTDPTSKVGVIYIARGADPNWQQRIERFTRSWVTHNPGIACTLYVNYKEFADPRDFEWARRHINLNYPHVQITEYMPFNSWGGGCFQEACAHVKEDLICTMVSTSEIMHDDWLALLYNAYQGYNAGLVGCTGSREATPHVRDTAIIIDKEFYLSVSRQFDFTKSKDGYLDFEHGPNNLTQQVLRTGKPVLIVEQNRVVPYEQWGHTTYHGNMHNVLVHDRGARDFKDL